MPGMMDTVLNVGDRQHLKDSVTAVFESWNSERAVQYRARNHVRCIAGTAVTVQAMFPAESAGVLFTEDPTNPAARRIVIEAVKGLGEALVSGHAQPDVFILDRQNLAIVERRTAALPPLVKRGIEGESPFAPAGEGGALAPGEGGAVLSDAQASELARIGLRIEEYFGYPVDIEWGWHDGHFALLQSRRIRGLDIAQDVPVARQEEIARLKRLADGRGKVAWAVHNLGETLSFPTPLTWDIVSRFMASPDGFLGVYTDLGYRPSERVMRDGFLELIAGRVYADVERSAELFFGDFPLTYDVDHGGPEQLLGAPSVFNYERAGAAFLLKLPFHLLTMLRAGRILRRASAACVRDFERGAVPVFLDYARQAREKNLVKLTDAELLAELADREHVALHRFGRETLKPGFLASYFHARLLGNLELVFGAEQAAQLTASLLRGLDGDKTVECNIALYGVAQGSLELASFLGEFGHRAAHEFELSEPRWREDPASVERIVASYKQGLASGRTTLSPAELHRCQNTERKEMEAKLGGVLQSHGASSLEAAIRADLAATQLYLPYRETGKHYFMLAVALIRDVLEEFARRCGLGRDLYFLHRDELAAFPSRRDELLKQIAARKVRWQAQQRLPVPQVITTADLDAVGRAEEPRAAQGNILKGTGVAAGCGTGTARIILSPHDAGALGENYVLVCPSTDPGWTPLFVHASGLVVERGGMLSHGAIVARDFGIPAVVLPDATRLIANGASVKVDGGRGIVELVTEKS
jgi:pyruvate,water dikinase